ncbi:hypothetical protein BVC93_01275 [Mycobacterium sp. MS1601]|uniref:YceI family protein n=1 Tax=Mycobacterium sp. MS1601 TaxID=1936029 RepID=UPI00097940C2|nr:YceI family protein [Mycobacterium sp. MS1601]AQA01280.1 hypothetical protein BVC93_01275 [Mycobacterium sp. MS1601]
MTSLEQLLANPDNAAVWTLVPNRSEVRFTCRSFWGLLPVKGRFTEFSGEGQLSGGTAFGRIDIVAASLDTGNRKRDEHLRSEDFFAVDRFPTLSVVVTAVQQTGGHADLRSSLTVRGVTQPLTLPAQVSQLNDGAVQISATTTIDRTRWDVDGNLLGMVRTDTTLVASAVFTKSG